MRFTNFVNRIFIYRKAGAENAPEHAAHFSRYLKNAGAPAVFCRHFSPAAGCAPPERADQLRLKFSRQSAAAGKGRKLRLQNRRFWRLPAKAIFHR
jgi:hypothetical protein